jgi:uncharacterized protein
MIRILIIISVIFAAVAILLALSRGPIERSLLFYPSHRLPDGRLAPWIQNKEWIGFSRKVEAPKNVWLMLHGNGGQASDRAYAIPSFSHEDSVFIMEYPGYGHREGVPSKEAFNRAANEAYLLLRETYPRTPICVVGESIGSGPAATLASLSFPPDKVVLVVPFDKLSLVAKDLFPHLMVRLLMSGDWDNIEALSGYKGPMEIYGAVDDTVIPVKHAKALSAGVPSAKFHLIESGHNEWSFPGRVRIRNP